MSSENRAGCNQDAGSMISGQPIMSPEAAAYLRRLYQDMLQHGPQEHHKQWQRELELLPKDR